MIFMISNAQVHANCHSTSGYGISLGSPVISYPTEGVVRSPLHLCLLSHENLATGHLAPFHQNNAAFVDLKIRCRGRRPHCSIGGCGKTGRTNNSMPFHIWTLGVHQNKETSRPLNLLRRIDRVSERHTHMSSRRAELIETSDFFELSPLSLTSMASLSLTYSLVLPAAAMPNMGLGLLKAESDILGVTDPDRPPCGSGDISTRRWGYIMSH